MRRSLPLLVLAACSSGQTPDPATPASNEAPAAPVAARAEPLPPDPTQLCDVFTTIRLQLAYAEACGGPPSIELEYNPTGMPELAPTDGTSELATTSFSPSGCVIQGTWALGQQQLVLDVYATGPEQIGGTATYTDAVSSPCAVTVTGAWETWTSD